VPATRKELRLEAQTRLRDPRGTLWTKEELNGILNQAHDRLTRESEYLRAVNIQDVAAATASTALPYSIAPPDGFVLGRILKVQLYDGSVDNRPMAEWSIERYLAQNADARHLTTTRPYAYVRNFNPLTAAAGDLAPKDSLWLYPTCDTAYTSGLRVSYVQATRKLLRTEDTEIAMPDLLAYEGLLGFTVAEALSRGPRYGSLKLDPREIRRRIDEGRAAFQEALDNLSLEANASAGRLHARTRTRWV